MLSPATCCLVNPDGEKTVKEAFKMTPELSFRLREKIPFSNRGTVTQLLTEKQI